MHLYVHGATLHFILHVTFLICLKPPPPKERKTNRAQRKERKKNKKAMRKRPTYTEVFPPRQSELMVTMLTANFQHQPQQQENRPHQLF